jgi:hypothetical protein
MADAYGDLLHDLWIRELSPAAAGDGSLSLWLRNSVCRSCRHQ